MTAKQITLSPNYLIVFIFCACLASVSVRAEEAAAPNYLEQANYLLSQNKHEEALKLLYEATSREPNNPVLQQMLRRVFTLHVDHEISVGNIMILQNPKNLEGYLKVARALNWANNRMSAFETLLDGIHENPDAIELWMMMAQLEIQAGRYHEAFAVFQNVTELQDDNAKAHHSMAYILTRPDKIRSEDLSVAMAHAIAAVNLQPDNASFLDTLAEIHFRQGDHGKAIELIQKAIFLSPEEAFYQVQLSRFQYGMGHTMTQE